jgi:iron complex outermembrane receptor protein
MAGEGGVIVLPNHQQSTFPRCGSGRSLLINRALSVALAAMLGGPALAQPGGGDASANPAPGAGAELLSEIIVTAQRREQRLQDVPIAVSAFNQATLAQAGVRSSSELTQITPSLNFAQTAMFAQPTIRGVGTFNTHVGDEPNVASYVDGVYISQMLGNFYKLANIERIEVLKGPQGTLFGRNATGGAINIVTLDPSRDPEFRGEISYGRFNDMDAIGYISGGLTDTLSANLSASYNRRDGYYRNLVQNGKDEGERRSYAVRSKIRFKPIDALRLTFIGDISRSDDPNGILSHVLKRNSPAEAQGFNTSSNDYEVAFPASPSNIVKQRGLSLQTDVALQPFDIVSITAYRKTIQDGAVDSDGTAANLIFFNQSSRISDFMEEVRLVSRPDSAVQWIVGGFYYDSSAKYDPLIIRGGGGTPPFFTLFTEENTKAYAGFVDVTVPITRQLSISGGVRYSDETKEFTFQRTPALASVPNGRRPDASFSSWTPRAVLSYKPVDPVLLYMSYSKGFKTGGYNTSAPQDNAYLPETLRAYELGAKTTWGRGITFNVAAYHYDYSDLQVQGLTPGGTASVTNAATARMDGFDAEFSAQLTSQFTVRLGAAYLDGNYDRYTNASVFIPRVLGVPGIGNRQCVDRSSTGGVNECDVSGNQIARAPRLTFNAGATYSHELAGGYRVTASGNVFHSSSYPWEPLLRVEQPSYAMVNAQIELGLPGDDISFAIWGKNLTDDRVYTYVAVSGAGDRVQFADPMTYGASVRVRF